MLRAVKPGTSSGGGGTPGGSTGQAQYNAGGGNFGGFSGLTIASGALTGITIGTLSYTDTNILESFTGNANSYVQTILQNTDTAANASADYVVSNDLGTATTYYGDFGINSSVYSGIGSYGLPNATYLSSTTGDLSIGTTTNNAIHFFLNTGATDALTLNTAAASTAAFLHQGSLFTGGTATTTFPFSYFNLGATAPTSWLTTGTILGMNAPSGFAGNFLDFHTNGGASIFNVNPSGGVYSASTVQASTGLINTSPTNNIYIPSASAIGYTPTAGLQFAGSANNCVRLALGNSPNATLAAGYNYSAFQVGQTFFTTASSGTHAWLASAVLNNLGTVYSGGATVTNTGTVFVATNSATIGANNYTLYIQGGQNKNAGGWAVNRTPETASYAILNTDYIVAFTALSAAVNATLPSSNLIIGQQHIIKDESGSAGTYNITVVGTIDGATNKLINTAYGSLKVYYNGTNWSTY